jgi:hypothetical protein
MSKCGCGREDGHCVKGDLDRCPALDEDDYCDDERDPGEECGRWDQNAKGGMSPYCRLAGTEFCDFDCPYSR